MNEVCQDRLLKTPFSKHRQVVVVAAGRSREGYKPHHTKNYGASRKNNFMNKFVCLARFVFSHQPKASQAATPIINEPAILLSVFTFARFCRNVLNNLPPDA